MNELAAARQVFYQVDRMLVELLHKHLETIAEDG